MKDPIDDPIDDPQPGPATVTLNQGGTPVEGLTVMFHDENGALIDSVETDGDGTATVTIPPNAMMSLVVPTPDDSFGLTTYTALYTMLGVQPNDVYEFDMESEGDDFVTFYQNVTVNLPGVFEGAAHYSVSVGCGQSVGDTQQFSMGLHSGCLMSNGKHAVFAVAQNASEQVLAYSFVDDQVPVPAPPANFGTPALTVNMPAWQTGGIVNGAISVDNFPVGINSAYVYTEAMREGAYLYYQNAYDGDTFQQPGSAADTVLTSIYLYGGGGYGGDLSNSWDVETAPQTAFDVDVSERTIGRIHGQNIDTGNAARPTMEIFSTVDAEDIDGGMFCVEYGNFQGPAFGAGVNVVWNFLVPPSTTMVQFPELPEALASMAPNVGTSWNNMVTTQFAASTVDGYDALREGGRFDIAGYYPDKNETVAGYHGDLAQYFYGDSKKVRPVLRRGGSHRPKFGGGGPPYCDDND